MNNTTQHDALTSVMADAGALPCSRCGKRTAVRVGSNEDVSESISSRRGQDLIWCFECGHEEPITH
jgi:hypothetical protein